MDSKNSDNTQRQSSRSAANLDAIDCIVNTSDLAFEAEALDREQERPGRFSNSRRDPTIKRSNENLTYRSTRQSPSTNHRKHHTSPRSSSSSSRSHHHPPRHHHHNHHHQQQQQQHQSQRYHRVSSPSPSPPPPPPPPSSSSYKLSSRHQRSINSTKRPHSPSRSPYDRRPIATHRSHRATSKERNNNSSDGIQIISPADNETKSGKKSVTQEATDLSFVSEDELTKPSDSRTNNTTTIESASVSMNTKLHSTPSVPVLQPKLNESILETSNIPQEGEISLFTQSSFSTPPSAATAAATTTTRNTPMVPKNDFLNTIDLISKYKVMHEMPCSDPQIHACSKDILTLIKRQIELQKIELDCREREIKLHERELVEREKRFNEQSNDTTSTTAINYEPSVSVKSTVIEQNLETTSNQNMKDVSEEQSIASTINPTKVTVTNKSNSDQSSVIRKKNGKSRFSPSIFVPSIQDHAVIDLYSDDLSNSQSALSINTNNSLKKTTISKILAPTEPDLSIVDTDLKVTSSNSCRKVEFQRSGSIDKTATTTSKGSNHDLRLTIRKNRTKNQNNLGDNDATGSPLNSDDESSEKSEKAMSSKVLEIKDDKQQSNDYHQQRSFTSTSIEPIIDEASDKRDNRRQQHRFNSSRQPHYAAHNSPSSNNSTKERPYSYESATQSTSKYAVSQKRHDNDDLRSHLHKQKHPKSSRATHRNNYER